MRLKRWLTSLLVLFLGYTTPSFAQPAELVPIRLQLTWSHQAQFAGVYVAQIRKHFAAAGIDLIVFPGGPALSPINELQNGNADVAIAWFNNACVAYHIPYPNFFTEHIFGTKDSSAYTTNNI